jgi:protein TonB
MPVVTFACDLCGALGRAQAPGTAQCATCGWVALVQEPVAGAPDLPVTPLAEQVGEPDPFAAAAAPADPSGERVDFVLDDEVLETRTPRPAALPQLWSPPGRHDATNPGTIPVPRRPRPRRRLLVPALSLVAGVALAAGGAMVLRGRSPADEDARASVAEVAPPPPAVRRARPAVPPAVPVPASIRRDVDEPTPVAAPVPIPAAAAPESRLARGPAAAIPQKSQREEPFLPRAVEARNPAPLDRHCVPRALRARRDLAGRLDGEIKARFPVAASGEIGRIEVLGEGMDPDVAAAVEEAIRSCPFVPGADTDGRPTPLSVVMKIRFAVR